MWCVTLNVAYNACDMHTLVLLQLAAEPPKLAEYQTYIDYELKEGDPARVQITFERALAENCLVPDMWTKYNTYLVSIEHSTVKGSHLFSHVVSSQLYCSKSRQ